MREKSIDGLFKDKGALKGSRIARIVPCVERMIVYFLFYAYHGYVNTSISLCPLMNRRIVVIMHGMYPVRKSDTIANRSLAFAKIIVRNEK